MITFEIQPNGSIVKVYDPPKPADMVSVVRCMDCEYCEQLPPEKDKQYYRWCYELSRHVTKNEFCAWGERRDA